VDNYKINHVAKLTGLTKHVIRSWERRFDLLKPERGDNRYRVYSQEDVDLLIYARNQLEEGFVIGELASLGRENLINQMQSKKERAGASDPLPLERIHNLLVSSLTPFDRVKFIRALNESTSLLAFDEVFYKIFIPLQRKVGDLWHQGKIGVGEEHFVTNQIRQKFLSILNQIPVAQEGPKIVIACLPNDYHELSAWMAAYQCSMNSCQVFYLGSNMPVNELGSFCSLTRPNLVILSGTGDFNDKEARSLVEDYAKLVLPFCPVWAGGPAMNSLRSYCLENGIDVLESLYVLEDRLKRISHFLNKDF
jgi:MerR family transcriptional regulator, light-induced transcriptional regulator